MFCKFCGETIDRRTMKCPSCGKSVGPLAGGVGFWDLAGQPSPAAAAVNPDAMEQRQGRSPANHQKGNRPASRKLPILSLAALLLALILLVMNLIMWGEIRALEKNYEELASKPNWVGEILEGIDFPAGSDATEAQSPETTNAAEPPAETTTEPVDKKPGWIFEQPEDRVLTGEEIASGKPIKLFSLKVDGKDLEFRWEKYDAEAGNWMAVDEKRFEEEDEDFMGSEMSMLVLNKWSEDAYGQYRCVIFDEAGNREITISVFLKPGEEK